MLGREGERKTVMAAETTRRRVRAFKRWMKQQGIDFSDALDITISEDQVLSITALADLHVGDVVATIPTRACLTVFTTLARELIDGAGLDGSLGLAVAIMHERSLGDASPWAPYLAILPEKEAIPLVWTPEEAAELLRGTELHDTVREDTAVMMEDWRESIEPLRDQMGDAFERFFGFEDYVAARTLIASRSFQVDDHYHGVGMVPLADIFNHKTAAEDVHLNTSASGEESESEEAESGGEEDEESANDSSSSAASGSGDDNGVSDDDDDNGGGDDDDLEMVMVKDVKVGVEVFNTYGLLGNAALLHRYGFTEPDNPFDIVNIDLELVLRWYESLVSGQHRMARVSLWRRLGYSGCASGSSEYFEISFNGEPPNELLFLLYIMFLQQDAYDKVDLALSTVEYANGNMDGIVSEKSEKMANITAEFSEAVLLTNSICDALLSLADMRESLYGKNSIEDDIEALKRCCIKERKLYHSLILRISERKIIQRFRTFASSSSRVKTSEASPRKKLKRK